MEKREKQKKRAQSHHRPAIVIVVVVLLIYLVVQFVSAQFSGIKTENAVRITADDSISAEGYLFRNEIPIERTSDGTVRQLFYNGERVQKDSPVVMLYADKQAAEASGQIEPLQNRIALVDEAIAAADDFSDAAKSGKQVELAIETMISAASDGQDELSRAAKGIRTALLQQNADGLDKASLESEKQALQQKISESEAQMIGKADRINAPESGYFSNVIDGYEQVFTMDELSTLTPQRLDELWRVGGTPSANQISKIVAGFSWYVACEVSAEQAARFQRGLSMQLRFSKLSLECPVVVSQVTEQDGRYLVVVEGNIFNADLVTMRAQPVELIFASYTGLRVPIEAVRILYNQDGTPKLDADGKNRLGVYVLSGSITRIKRIEPLYQNDEFYVVWQSATEVDALVAQDRIIVQGKDLQNNMVVNT